MPATRRITLFLATAFAAIAIASSAAQAQETAVAIKTEAGGACNPCVVHIAGEASIFAGPTEISRCHDEFTARLFTSSGETEWVGTADRGPGCNTVNCIAPEHHWPITSVGETSANVVHMTVRFCLNGNHCNGEVTIFEAARHRYVFSMNQTCPTGARVTGGWSIEGTPIEIDHTP